MSSIGGWLRPRAPRNMLTKDICCVVAEPARFGVALGGDDVDADHGIGTVELLGRLEAAAVDLQRRQELVGREMRGEGVGQAELGGELRAERLDPRIQSGTSVPAPARPGCAGSDRPERGMPAARARPAGNSSAASGVRRKRAQRELVGARGAAEPEVDAAGKQPRQRAELFGDDERRVVRQHDAAGADPDGLCAGRDMADARPTSRRWRCPACCDAPPPRCGDSPSSRRGRRDPGHCRARRAHRCLR